MENFVESDDDGVEDDESLSPSSSSDCGEQPSFDPVFDANDDRHNEMTAERAAAEAIKIDIEPIPFQQLRNKEDRAAHSRGTAATSYRSLRHDAKLVNRRVSVYWDGDDMWYSGTVREFDVVDDSHVVQYDDGDVQR